MHQLSVQLPDDIHDGIESLVDDGHFGSKAEAIRYYLRQGLQRDIHRLDADAGDARSDDDARPDGGDEDESA